MIETIVLKIGKAILAKLLWVGIGVLLTLLLFATLCKQKPQTVTVEVPAQEILSVLDEIKTTQKIIRGIKFPKSYTIYLPGETIYIDSATPYGDVPVVETQFDTSFALLVNKQKEIIRAGFAIIHKGEVFNHRFFLYPTTFTIDVPGESALRLWGNAGLGYTTDNKVPGCAELGLLFKKRVSLSGQVIHVDDWYWIGWLKVWL